MKYLGTMTYRQVEQYREKTNMALLPVGATEAHGPHLPLMVDSVSAEEIAKEPPKNCCGTISMCSLPRPFTTRWRAHSLCRQYHLEL